MDRDGSDTTRSAVRPRLAAAATTIAGLALASCYPPLHIVRIEPYPGTATNYLVGRIQTVGADLPMIERTEGSQVLPGFVLEKPIRVRHLMDRPLETSLEWKARFEYKGDCPSGRFILTSRSLRNDRLGIIVSEDGTIACPHPVRQLGGAKKGRSWDLEEPLPIQPFRPVSAVMAKLVRGAVRWKLMFRGYENGKLILEYREYRARVHKVTSSVVMKVLDLPPTPTSVETVTIDLPRPGTIAYRGITMEIASVSSDQIAFRVVHETSAGKP
jgi:hypothetical protein